MTTLAEIREKLAAAEANSNREVDNSIYPFWNLKDGQESVVRFLPDGDESNIFFWVERQLIKLPFVGVKGTDDTKEYVVQVPCNEMYNGECPILSTVRPWFKSPELEDIARRYWKKRSYVFQAFVVQDGLEEEQKPDNPIRRLIITPKVFQLVRSALLDPELDELPTDYVHGLDFRIKRTSSGKYADYTTSTWARKERPLSQAERDAIEEHSLYNLSTFLPKQPSAEELGVIKDMFEASVDGLPYDLEAWGKFYKPYGLEAPSQQSENSESTRKPKPTATPAVQSKPVAKQEPSEPEETGDSRAQDILKMIRNRQTTS